MPTQSEPGKSRSWLFKAVLLVAVVDFPQWIQAVFGLFTAEPLIPWLQKKGLKMPHISFSPFWISSAFGVVLACLVIWIDRHARNKMAGSAKVDQEKEHKSRMADIQSKGISTKRPPIK